MISQPQDVLDYFECVYRLDRPLGTETAYQYRHTLTIFNRWLGHNAGLPELSDDSVSAWIESLEPKYAQTSVCDHRRVLLLVWRHAARRGMASAPLNVRRAVKPQPLPIAWTLAELRRILVVCEHLTGRFPQGALQREYCLGLVHAGWDSGLRRSDLWTVRRDQIRDDGQIVLRQRKTGAPHFPRLRTRTLELVRSLPGDPPLRCPYASPRWWYRWWRINVIEPAGVRHGVMQQLRRSAATHLASEHPEAVQRFLGHSSPEMQRHYIDWSIARPPEWLPPEIG